MSLLREQSLSTKDRIMEILWNKFYAICIHLRKNGWENN